MNIVGSSFFAKRIYTLGLAVLAVVGVSACGKNNDMIVPPIAPTVSLRPFGAHSFSYTPGSIKPTSVTQAQLDQATTNFYDQWKAKYLRAGCGLGRYYIWTADTSGGGKAPGSISISEGHGYGMIITALMSGYDPNAKTYFDGMFRYFKDHPAVSSPNLMAWNQLADCTNSPAPYGGSGTATDGDLDISFALVLADRQWGTSTGSINYLQVAKNARISGLSTKALIEADLSRLKQ